MAISDSSFFLLCFSAVYLLVGIAFYLCVELGDSNGEMKAQNDYFSPMESAAIVIFWPFWILYLIYHAFRIALNK